MSGLISTVDPNAYYTSPAPKKNSGLNMDTFLRLLTVQLSTQNPLEPMKDSDMFAQISQLGQVQGMQTLQDQGDFAKAQSLIGKVVDAVITTGASSASNLVTGVVSGVTIGADGAIKLNVTDSKGKENIVALESIQNVYNQPETDEGPIPSDYAYLIGKQVAGKNGTVDVTGQVTSIGTSNGVIMVDVLNSAGVKLQLPVGQITTIS